MADPIYTELIVLKLKDETEAAMATATQRFAGSVKQIETSLARIGPVAASVAEIAGGELAISLKTMAALWQGHFKQVAAEERAAAADMAASMRAQREQAEADARQENALWKAINKEKAAQEKATAEEEQEIAKELHRYRQEEAKEEATAEKAIARELTRYRREAAAEEREIARELFRYRQEMRREELAAEKAQAKEEREIAKELHRYRQEEETPASGGMTSGVGDFARSAKTAGVVAASATAYKLWDGAKEYNDALRDMGTLLDSATTDQVAFNTHLAEAGALAGEFSSKFNIDVVDVLKSFREALSSGFDGSELRQVGEIAGEMSRAMRVSMTESMDVLSTIRNAWHLDVEDMRKAGDGLFNMVNYGRIRMEEIRTSFGRVSAAAAAVGLSFNEIGAALVVLTKDGETNSQAVTALASALTRMTAMSDEVKAKFAELGLTAQDFNFHTHNLSDTLEKIGNVSHHSAELLRELFPEAREFRGILDLTTHMDSLREAEKGMTEQGTLLVAANRNLDNGFDRLGSTARAVWNGITSSIETALNKYYEWTDALTTQNGRSAKLAKQDFMRQQMDRYGDLFVSSGQSSADMYGDADKFGSGKDEASLAKRRQAIAEGTMSEERMDALQAAFNKRLAEEVGFRERVLAVTQATEALAKKKAQEKSEDKQAAQYKDLYDQEAGEQVLAQQSAAKNFKKYMKDEVEVYFKKQVELAMEAQKKAYKEAVQEAKSYTEHMGEFEQELLRKHEEKVQLEKNLTHELGQEMLSIYAKDAEEAKRFNEIKLTDAKRINSEMKKDLENLSGLESSLNERMFQHAMQHAGNGGKDPARAARFAQGQIEQQEAKIDAAIKSGTLSEKDFAHMIEEFRKFGDARGQALTVSHDDRKADREALERDSVEQGMIQAFRKMETDRAANQVDAINSKVFKAKTADQVKAEALQKTEAKHVDQNVNMNVALNLQGITTSQIQGMVKDMLTGALKDIQTRGTGVTGRPSTARGAPVGRGDTSDDGDTQ